MVPRCPKMSEDVLLSGCAPNSMSGETRPRSAVGEGQKSFACSADGKTSELVPGRPGRVSDSYAARSLLSPASNDSVGTEK
jgi:hypothetical protein